MYHKFNYRSPTHPSRLEYNITLSSQKCIGSMTQMDTCLWFRMLYRYQSLSRPMCNVLASITSSLFHFLTLQSLNYGYQLVTASLFSKRSPSIIFPEVLMDLKSVPLTMWSKCGLLLYSIHYCSDFFWSTYHLRIKLEPTHGELRNSKRCFWICYCVAKQWLLLPHLHWWRELFSYPFNNIISCCDGLQYDIHVPPKPVLQQVNLIIMWVSFLKIWGLWFFCKKGIRDRHCPYPEYGGVHGWGVILGCTIFHCSFLECRLRQRSSCHSISYNPRRRLLRPQSLREKNLHLGRVFWCLLELFFWCALKRFYDRGL